MTGGGVTGAGGAPPRSRSASSNGRGEVLIKSRPVLIFLATVAANVISGAMAAWGFTPPGTRDTRWLYVGMVSLPNLILVLAAWITRHRLGRSLVVFTASALTLLTAVVVYPGIRVPSTDGQGNLGQVFAMALHVLLSSVMSLVAAALAYFTTRDDALESTTDKTVFAVLVVAVVATVLQGLLVFSNVFA